MSRYLEVDPLVHFSSQFLFSFCFLHLVVLILSLLIPRQIPVWLLMLLLIIFFIAIVFHFIGT